MLRCPSTWIRKESHWCGDILSKCVIAFEAHDNVLKRKVVAVESFVCHRDIPENQIIEFHFISPSPAVIDFDLTDNCGIVIIKGSFRVSNSPWGTSTNTGGNIMSIWT